MRYPSISQDGIQTNALALASDVQRKIFGMRDGQNSIAPHLLGILESLGGSVTAIYSQKEGFTSEGWIGLGIILPGKNGELSSKFLGVREDMRDAGIAGDLRFLQAYQALKSGADTLVWAQDPVVAPIGKLSIGKLGGVADKITIEKYGDLFYDIYASPPADLITVKWNLLSDRVHAKIASVVSRNSPEQIESITQDSLVTKDTVQDVATRKPAEVYCEIPVDLKKLTDEERLKKKLDIRAVLEILLDSERADIPEGANDPALVGIKSTQGDYVIYDFITTTDGTEQKNYIKLRKKDTLK